MALTPGSRLGPYEVTSLIGAGGMGEVFRARDSKLNREVALKILPEAFASDPERLARFRREAQVLASLNHPNIAAIYGFEESNGTQALVLELVEGPTLADRIAQGSVPLEEALPIARQIIDALEAAHEQGIIHRDLKPANIKLRADGTVKVLDFGLAKTVGNTVAGSSLSNSPTFSVHATQAGVILGTAAYMAPEQAKGLLADHRSDIFSFGVVLYEMLTGRNPFQGDTTPEILASVLMREPDLTALPGDLNPRLGEVLRRCLNKHPKTRWQAVGDLRVELDAIAANPRATADASRVEKMPVWRRAMTVALTALVTATSAGIVGWIFWPTQPPPLIVGRYVFPLGEGQNFSNAGRQAVAISPDGARMVYVANTRLYLRSMSELDARAIPGTEAPAGAFVTNPVFSPDGQTIVFWAGGNTQEEGSLKRIAVTGGVPVALSEARNPYGLSWTDDEILVGQGPNGIMRLLANGGKPDVLITLSAEERAHGPQMLPGKQAVLFTLLTGTSIDWDRAKIVVQQLRTGERKTILEAGSDARYLPSGHIVYALGGTVFGVPFNPRRLELLGAPVPIIEGVRRGGASTGTAHFSTSSAGSLVYIPGPTAPSAVIRNIVLLDRSGSIERLKLPPGPYDAPRISPNGTQIAFSSDDGKEQAIWVYDLSRTAAPRQLTVGGNNRFPVWSSDGRRVAFQSDREGDFAIFWQLADGTAPAARLTKPEKGVSHIPESWIPRSDIFLFRVATEQNKFNLWTFSTQDKKATPFGGVQSMNPPNAVFSPDGQWVAYYSDEAGGAALWLQPFPATGIKQPLAPDGDSHHPLWSPDGRELLYVRGQNQLSARSIKTHPTFSFDNPAQVPVPTGTDRIVLLPVSAHRPFDITRAGKIVGLLNVAAPGTPTTPQIHVVLNWLEELKQRVPVK